jgi:peroxiredoxin
MLSAGQEAPEFALPGVDGERYSLADALARGAVLLAFFALDCQTCEMSFIFWDRIHERYSGNGFQLWGVSLDPPDEARSFVERSGVSFPVLLDDALTVVSTYGADATPALFLVQGDGAIRASHEGFDRSALEDMAATVAGCSGLPALEISAAEAPELRPGCAIHVR